MPRERGRKMEREREEDGERWGEEEEKKRERGRVRERERKRFMILFPQCFQKGGGGVQRRQIQVWKDTYKNNRIGKRTR